MNWKARLLLLGIFAIIMSLGGASSQTSPITDKAFGKVISEANGFAGAVYENRDNPTSPQAITDYEKGVAQDVVETGAVYLAKKAAIKTIIYKGAASYVAARAAGNYAAAEVIKAGAISQASVAGAGITTGAFIATVFSAAVILYFSIPPEHTDYDPYDSTTSPTDTSKSNTQDTPTAASSPPDESKSFSAVDASFGAPSSSGDVQSRKTEISPENDLGGVNFTSIKLNSIALSTDQDGGVNLDLIHKAQKAEGTSPGIDLINSTLIGATAFMTGLAVSDEKFWVNLAPWEPDRIIDEQLRESEVGRIMLEADLQMKKDLSNYENPCASETDKALPNLLEEKRKVLAQRCMDRFPGMIKNIDNVWFKPATRYWIVPDKIYAYTNETQIYIINATLTINSEPIADHSSFRLDNQYIGTLSQDCLEELNKSAEVYSAYYKELTDGMILPYVIEDVNHGEKYEDLRDVYVALALAQWYKSSITSHMDIFRERLDSSNFTVLKSIKPWSPNDIWDKYVYSFKNGEYKCWENTTTNTAIGTTIKSILRSSGGADFASIRNHLIVIDEIPPEILDQVKRAISDGFIAEEKDVLFGNRLHLDSGQNNSVSGSGSLTNAIRLDPNLALDWYNRGIALQDRGKFGEAVEAFDESLRLNPNLALAWGNKGAALFSHGEYDEAIKACDEAIRLDPNYAYAWNNKGSALGMQQKYDEAVEAYDEAIRLDPNNADARNNKKEILKALGRNS